MTHDGVDKTHAKGCPNCNGVDVLACPSCTSRDELLVEVERSRAEIKRWRLGQAAKDVFVKGKSSGPDKKRRILARFPETARRLAGAPDNARVQLIQSAMDRDPYGSSMDDRDLWEVTWTD